MFSSDQFDSLIKEVAARLGVGDTAATGSKNNSSGGKDGKHNSSAGSGSSGTSRNAAISPEKALVIAGLLGGVFEVTSVLVDKRQRVEILLSGSLRRKTQLDMLMDQIGQLPFDEVVRAIIDRFD
ncbi:MAG: hypothetical protein QHH06_03875 [Clostridiales bacterium]|nr:hypothetical protein [Eubacteriales bacterium]MDH7565605.1 hypothetical protein [Clostridiales bacterium]